MYRVQAACNQDASAVGQSADDVRICVNGPIVYYVNDDSTTNDAWCTAAGDDANDGLSPGSPKATIQDVIDCYYLGPGDVVRIDTGTYNLSATVTVTDADQGDRSAPLAFEASPYGVTIDGGGTSGWYVTGASYVTIGTVESDQHPAIAQSWMTVTGGSYGIHANYADYLTIDRVEAASNSAHGVVGNSSDFLVLANSSIHDNGDDGVSFSHCNDITVENNTVALNGNDQVYLRFCSSATLRNNILWADGAGNYALDLYSTYSTPTSDYNLLYATSGALVSNFGGTLAEWQATAGEDANSISVDPLFVDGANGDFHLQSTAGRYDLATGAWVVDSALSPAIDAGDPGSDFSEEPTPNGAIVNLGAYGGTEQASKSDPDIGKLFLYATEDDDTVVVSTDGSNFTVTINGVSAVYSMATYSSIVIDGEDGSDSLDIYDWTGDDTFAVDPTEATMDWGSDGVDVTGLGFETVKGVAANGGTDEAMLTGTTGDDKFYGKATQAYVYDVAGTDYRYTASGFDTVTGVSGGGDDTAYLYGSTGDDALDVTVGSATMIRFGSTTSMASGFAYVNGYGVAGGIDSATIIGTTGTDLFTAKDTYAYMRNVGGSDYLLYVTSFSEVTAYGDADDTAYLYGGATDDTLDMSVGLAILIRSGSTTTVANDFGTVNGYAGAGGTDTATMTGTTGADMFSGEETGVYMRNVGGTDDYFLYAASFSEVTAYGNGGADDVAYLYGSAGDDMLEISVGTATMTRSGSATTVANDFATVNGYAGAGGTDTAVMTGSTGADGFYGRETLAYMRNIGGSDYFHYTRDFSEVTACGNGGDDAAYLWDGAGDDTFDVSAGLATMIRSGSTTTAASDFASVYGYATPGWYRHGQHDRFHRE